MAYEDTTVNLKMIFTSLIEALEVADPYTRGHSDRVGSLAVALALDLGLSTRELEILKDAGALHDIGKIGVSGDILNKPGKLTDTEYEEVKRHPTFGYNILKPLAQQELLDCTLYHHERLDGRGYPTGTSDIPLLARVTQIADVWDALTSQRPYRAAMPHAKARQLMGGGENTFGFDAELLESFMRLTRYIFPDDDCDPHELERIFEEVAQLRPQQILAGVGAT
jgi:putative two-component system response regulator